MYEDSKVYGPYLRKDNRLHVIIVSKNGRRTLSYPRYLMEKYLGRFLHPYEDVHHKDGDISNNKISNLEVVNYRKHTTQHSIKYTKVIHDKCLICDKKITLNLIRQRNLRSNIARGKRGPFCSRVCSGKYGVAIQSALKEISRVESPKVGEAFANGNPEPSLRNKEGVETRRATPKTERSWRRDSPDHKRKR